jgi:hypothetical protein
LLLLVFTACNASNLTPVDVAPPAGVIAEATRTLPLQEPDRYHNPEAGISLVLPEGWRAAGPTSIALGDAAYNLYTIGSDPETSGGPGLSQLIVAQEGEITIDAFLQAQCSTCDPHPLQRAILNGIEVQRTLVGGGGVPFEVEWVFLTHNSRLIGLSLHDPESLGTLESVLETLQFE